MATYRIGPTTIRAAGSLGGAVYRPQLTHGVVSAKPSPRRRRPVIITSQLERNAIARQAWSDLDDTNRGFWQTMVDEYQQGFGFSAPLNMSAYALYVRTYAAMLAAGVTTPPTFPIFQVQGRRQAVVTFEPRTSAGEWIVRWALGLSGNWINGQTWVRVRATAVSPASVKRPRKTYRTTEYIDASDLGFSPFFSSVTLTGYDFPFDRGWVRWEFTTFDEFGWWTNERDVVWPVLPQGEPWFFAYGPDVQGLPNGHVSYDGTTLRVTWTNQNGTLDQSVTIGKGGLTTVGQVADWLDLNTGLRIVPPDADSMSGDATALRLIPGATTNMRDRPAVFDFSAA